MVQPSASHRLSLQTGRGHLSPQTIQAAARTSDKTQTLLSLSWDFTSQDGNRTFSEGLGPSCTVYVLQHQHLLATISFFLMFIYFCERERQSTSGGGAEGE